MIEKWLVDDAGTLINMETRNTYDYMEDIVDILNEKEERIKELENKLNWQERETTELQERNDRQYKQLTHLHKLIDKQEWEILTKEREQMKEEDKRLLELENIPVRCMRIHYGE
jgi:DNA repair exonuclease SbcCD ATPase subunit